MKRYLIIVIIIASACSKNIAQQPVANNKQGYRSLKEMNYDTLNYIKTSFIDRKSYYEHKEFNVLLNDLEIPITYFLTAVSAINKFISPGITIEFFAKNKIELKRQRKIDPVIMTIEWGTPLPMDSVGMLVRKNKGVWTDEEKKYFSKQKVKKIDMVRFNFEQAN